MLYILNFFIFGLMFSSELSAQSSFNSKETKAVYEIIPQFEVLIGTEPDSGLQAFRIPTKTSDGDKLQLSLLWGADGYIYLSIDHRIYVGMQPAPKEFGTSVPAEVRNYRRTHEIFKVTS